MSIAKAVPNKFYADTLDMFDETKYPAGFFAWLERNRHIYNAFETRALRMWRTGRRAYSARTIIEVIRWNTDIREHDVLFKINNNWVPGMARYFMERWPECAGFFSLREHGA